MSDGIDLNSIQETVCQIFGIRDPYNFLNSDQRIHQSARAAFIYVARCTDPLHDVDFIAAHINREKHSVKITLTKFIGRLPSERDLRDKLAAIKKELGIAGVFKPFEKETAPRPPLVRIHQPAIPPKQRREELQKTPACLGAALRELAKSPVVPECAQEFFDLAAPHFDKPVDLPLRTEDWMGKDQALLNALATHMLDRPANADKPSLTGAMTKAIRAVAGMLPENDGAWPEGDNSIVAAPGKYVRKPEFFAQFFGAFNVAYNTAISEIMADLAFARARGRNW